MKSINNKIMYAVIIALVIIIISIMSIRFTDYFYSRVAMITEINTENNLITATCVNGNMYSFYDTSNDWFCGDFCSLIMFDNFTENIYDDKVISARYGGYVELFEEIAESIEG